MPLETIFMNTRAAIVFTGNWKAESKAKGLPSRFLPALHENLLSVIRRLPSVDLIIASTDLNVLTLTRDGRSIRLRGKTLAEQLSVATDWTFSEGYDQVLLIAGDIADASENALQAGFAALQGPGGRSVVGRSRDGGFWLAGFNRRPDVDWEMVGLRTPHAASRLIASLRKSGIPVATVSIVDDIDCLDDAVPVVNRLRLARPAFRRRLVSILASMPPSLSPQLPHFLVRFAASSVIGRAPPSR
ncbi:MAG: DUF2064 domain-containing protein [Acidobacteriota bacterium]